VRLQGCKKSNQLAISSCSCLEESEYLKKIHRRSSISEELSTLPAVIDIEALANRRPATLFYTAFVAEILYVAFSAENMILRLQHMKL
jgi:hypothetical protein